MNRISLKEVLKNYIKAQGSVTSGMTEDITKKHEHKISYGERLLRLLAEEGFIKAIKHSKGYIISYKWIGEEKPVFGTTKPETKLGESMMGRYKG